MPISFLLINTITFLSLRRFSTSLSSSESSLEPSSTASISAADSRHFLALSTPIFSTVSSVSLIPAVSVSTRGIPPILAYSSILSLVVPGISVTIALCSFKSIFMMLDFPAFGLPIIAVFRPSRRILPVSAELNSLSIFCISFSIDSLAPSIATSSISSSGKSIEASR